MFLLLSLITLIVSSKSNFSFEDEYIPNYNNLKRLRNYSCDFDLGDCNCISELIWTNLNFTEILICTLNCWKQNYTKFPIFAKNIKAIIVFNEEKIREMGLNKTEEFIFNITIKIINNDTIIEQTTEILKPNNNETKFIDLMIELLNNKNFSEVDVPNFINRLMNITGFIELFKNIYSIAKTDILDFLEEFLLINFSDDIGLIFKLVRTNYTDILDDVLIFTIDMLRNYNNTNALYDTIANFLIEHNNTYDKIKEIMMDDRMRIPYEKLIFVDDKILNETKKLVLRNKTNLEMFLNIMRNKDCLLLGGEILKNTKNFTFILEKMPNFLRSIVRANSTVIEPLTEFFFELIYKITNENDDLSSMTFSSLQKFLGDKFKELDYLNYNITNDCIELFKYTYFNRSANDKSLFFLYLQKYIFDSSRNKGNFLPFDNCIDDSHNISFPMRYNISPAFVIGIFNENQQKEINKNSSFYFKYNYLRSYCFPFAYTNETEKKNNHPMCSDNDYKEILYIIYSLYSNISDINITSFSINKSNISPNALHNFYGVLGILFLGFPILINIFLLISGKIIENKQNKINEVGEINKNIKMKKNELTKVFSNASKNKIKFPEWYKNLNEFFNLKNNGKELFNFSFDNTNLNNFKGMTYIKGIIGIFTIITVLGQTFIALFNLPTKGYGIWDYYLMMSGILYFILFIGYRYSPRILFSCSGYTLIYKYLCYLEQGQKLYFFKFVFLQSYKYILLIFLIIIVKYPLYYIVFLIRQSKRPTWEIFKYFIDNEEKYFKRFFSFLFYLDENDSSIKQNLIFYYYIPINEVLFFILGTALISLGYKFKLRIDIVIFVLILLLYLLKIILYIIFRNKETKVYTTTDYYLFDYGLNLVHPLFNLSYFLIGMFFGLINYTIQKGITDFEKANNYQNIFLLSESENIYDNDEEEESQTIKKIRTFSKDETSTDMDKLNLDNASKTDESLLKKSSNNNKFFRNYINLDKKNKNERTKDIIDINRDSEADFEKYIIGENELGSNKIKYTDRIKQMPFLIWPIKFSNFHKTNKNKMILNFVIIIAFILFIFFVNTQAIFTAAKLKTDVLGKKRVEELSFTKVIPEISLNILFLLDIEVAIFVIQWINFILYFKEVGIIRNFLNHVYWSFFVKSYFSFNLISITVILLLFNITETVIKFNFSNIFLYTFINIILILLFTIVFYCCFELPFKKVFKFFLKGKDALNNEEDNDEYEEEENNENEEEKHLKKGKDE